MQVLLIIFAYLLGSLAWSVWIGQWTKGVDLREHGSGNAGATNAFRVLGTPNGILVLVLDALKGFLAVSLLQYSPYADQTVFALLIGFAAVLGHIFPIFAGFRGGKGIATLLGVIIALHPGAALLAMGTFLVSLLVSRIVSVSSMAAAISLPFWMVYKFQEANEILVIFSIAIALLVIATHRKNILRLFKGEESKVKLLKKQSAEHEVWRKKTVSRRVGGPRSGR